VGGQFFARTPTIKGLLMGCHWHSGLITGLDEGITLVGCRVSFNDNHTVILFVVLNNRSIKIQKQYYLKAHDLFDCLIHLYH